jgi:hypothetical protein
MHGTGAALSDAASKFGARHAEHVAQRPQQGHFRLRVDLVGLSVYGELNHGLLLPVDSGSFGRVFPPSGRVKTMRIT